MTNQYSEDVLRLNPELRQAAIPASKYHNARTEAKGLSFQSGHEASEVSNLILLDERHQIFALRLQVRFPLGNETYVADAVYLDDKLEAHIVDVKGFRTRDYLRKRKLFKAKYGREIEEL
jgi:hypothetical protein